MYNNQKIAKIEKILDKDPCYKNMQMYQIDTIHQHSNGHFPSFKIYKEDIIKHSPNIIDLIEEGDYVNGERVFATENRINDNGEKVILIENYDEWTDNGVIANKDIKSIVTKEQFNQVKYEV